MLFPLSSLKPSGGIFDLPQSPAPNEKAVQTFHRYSDAYDTDWYDEESDEDLSTLIHKVNSELETSIPGWRGEGTEDDWIERNSTLVRLTGKHPFNCEAPLNRLMHHGFITPVPLHFVRNHGAVPKTSWEGWEVEISGLVNKPMKITMDQLVSKFPSREFPATLVCAGNRRKEQNMLKQTLGFNWGASVISTSVWRGVPLYLVLQRCGVLSVKKGARYVCLEGEADRPGEGGSTYGTSIKLEWAMDPSREIILAYMQNKELLAPDHGFPLRVIIPGFTGGRMVKWLRRITIKSTESDNHYHYKDNRLFPSHVSLNRANDEGWWYKPDYIINELNVNSVITMPSHGEVLPVKSSTTLQPYFLKGYAYAGGGRKVTRVEVTMDGGETWRECDVDHPGKPSRYGKYWCWCFWSLKVEVQDLLAARELAVRAWDEALNSQPEKLVWNLLGMMNNCWFRVKANVRSRHRGDIEIVFEHPTAPGNQSGGWMDKERQLQLSSESSGTLEQSVSTPFKKTARKTFTMSEVEKNNHAESAWIIVHGHVYDCTRFLKDHPGGANSILINAGTDCTEEFDAIHSDNAKKMLEEYHIGEFVTSCSNYPSSDTTASSTPQTSDHGATTAGLTNLATIKDAVPLRTLPLALINPKEKIVCRLIKRDELSHNVRMFRFSLPSEHHKLGLPVGKHIFLRTKIDGKLCMRAYTPTSAVNVSGYFDLLIKVYFKNVHPKFPNGGLMSQHLDSLQLGSAIEFKGPFGHIQYLGRGKFEVDGKSKCAKKLAMLAGGTGITPMYQVIQAALADPEDETEMHLIYANRTEDDISLRAELDKWAGDYETRLKVWYVVERSVREGWSYSQGFITEEIMREHIPAASEDVLAMACGSESMIEFAVQPNLEKMNYDLKNSLLVF